MASSIGFVYILTNDYMPRVLKLGCSERAPSLRAEELSASTGVPGPFSVLCYVEVREFQRVERELHARFDDYRVETNREFFDIDCLELAAAAMFYHDGKLTFCHGELPPYLWQKSSGKVSDVSDLPDAYAKPQPPQEGLTAA